MRAGKAAPRAKPRSSLRLHAAIVAVMAGLAASTVAADTLAQPKDNTLEREAANYIRYREDVAAIEAMPFTNAEVTREAHRRLAAHDPEKIASGWVAYAALVASDQPEFAKSLEKEISKKPNRRKGELGGVDGLMSHAAQDPDYLRNLPGADKAVRAVLAMTVQDGARITELGEAFKTQAYAMQKTSWGKKKISPSQKRISEAATFGASRGAPPAPHFAYASNDGVLAPSLASANEEWAADWGEGAGQGKMTEKNAEVIVDRILILAARYSTDSLNPKIVKAYATNTKSERCLSMAKLTLDQCIAATRTPYEEAFCLGEHGLKDVATCTGWVAGAGAS
ncbi:hypothetical protein CW354_19885 [Marinicaulis flavus]|uniref:Uncharacterized protein n=2 Tax=Hyphococcus luteus TaxID=2058213 RepID=A0A2S7JZX0_9PROT|nr:hypothetical protein CW354_19885 [Marinicaulis flavus]